MEYKGKEITKELFEKAQQCESAQELLKLAEENGIELTADEAEAFLDENADIELDEDTMNEVAGGRCWDDCPADTCRKECSGYNIKEKNRIDE